MDFRKLIPGAIEQLSKLLGKVVERAEQHYQANLGDISYRGAACDVDTARRGLQHLSLKLRLSPDEMNRWFESVRRDAYFQYLNELYNDQLDETDFGLLLLVMAPEFDTGFERVYGFLLDDVTRRRPTVELAVMLFGSGTLAEQEILAALRRLGSVIDITAPADGRVGVANQVLRLDEQFARMLFGSAQLDYRLSSLSEIVIPTDCHLPVDPKVLARIAAIKPLRLYLHGPDRRVNLRLIEWLGNRLNRRLLIVDTPRLAAHDLVVETTQRLLREADLHSHILIFSGIDALHAPEKHHGWEKISSVLAKPPNKFVLLGSRPTLPPTTHTLSVMLWEIPRPSVDERFEYWTKILRHNPFNLQILLPVAEVQLLAERYSLTLTQIDLSLDEAIARARLAAAQNGSQLRVTFDDLSISARHQGGHDLESLTNKITPHVCLKNVVVPKDVQTQLLELTSRFEKRNWVFGQWGFAQGQSYRAGVNALFAGPSGTGKTMAAEAIAFELKKDLYKIDLTSVVSKYIGETEQKLEQVFQAGEATQAVLFFDEADSLLGKRSEVKDAHDRYANLEVSYLLQRMERYDGLIILATNLLGNLDQAFLRRMATIVHFAKPTAVERYTLWQTVWPTDKAGHLMVPLATKPGFAIDKDFLAERFDLTGGNIRNTAVAAAFLAAERPCPLVTMWDVLQGVRREFQKLGQLINDRDLGLEFFKSPHENDCRTAEEMRQLEYGENVEEPVEI